MYLRGVYYDSEATAVRIPIRIVVHVETPLAISLLYINRYMRVRRRSNMFDTRAIHAYILYIYMYGLGPKKGKKGKKQGRGVRKS